VPIFFTFNRTEIDIYPKKAFFFDEMMMNNNNLQTIQNNGFAVPLQLNPVPYGQEFVQVVMPMAAPTGPMFMQPVQPTQPQIITNISRETALFTPENGMLQKSEILEQCVESGEGLFTAPQGFSFISMDDYFRFGFNLIHFPTVIPAPEVQQVQRMETTNVLSQKNVNIRSVTPEPKPQTKQGVKHPHRSKQKKIMSVHSIVEETWDNKGKLAGDDEVLRGEDVLRIHVKTWEGLDLIQDVLDHVEQRVPISRIAVPFSMKNKFQKKGFIVYLKLQDKMYVPEVQDIFGLHKEHFKKCDVALPTMKMVAKPEKLEDIAMDMFLPPMMKRRESAGAAA